MTIHKIAMISALLLAACGPAGNEADTVPGRWYTSAQVERGRALFGQYCAECHGADASGTSEWRTPGADGHYPPPPLDGTAHAWHHPLDQLDQSIANGGVPFGGAMPGFAAALDAGQRLATIAWFQSQWPDDIYAKWESINARDN